MLNKDGEKKLNSSIEIERKFLITCKPPKLINGERIIQTYLFRSEGKELRIRISGNKCKMSIKVDLFGISREEYEYTIPIEDGWKLMKLEKYYPPIEKVRYTLLVENMVWEVDVFEGNNEGLVIAEIELNSQDQEFIKPYWIGDEVTQDKKYFNVNIFKNPYKDWDNLR